MVGESSSALVRTEVSAAAVAMMASAAAWSEEDGVGAPMVCQVDFLALRNSQVRPKTVIQSSAILHVSCGKRSKADL